MTSHTRKSAMTPGAAQITSIRDQDRSRAARLMFCEGCVVLGLACPGTGVDFNISVIGINLSTADSNNGENLYHMVAKCTPSDLWNRGGVKSVPSAWWGQYQASTCTRAAVALLDACWQFSESYGHPSRFLQP